MCSCTGTGLQRIVIGQIAPIVTKRDFVVATENVHIVQQIGKQTQHADYSSKVQLQERKQKKITCLNQKRILFFFNLRSIITATH